MAEMKPSKCVSCGKDIEISKFGSHKTAKCTVCKANKDGKLEEPKYAKVDEPSLNRLGAHPVSMGPVGPKVEEFNPLIHITREEHEIAMLALQEQIPDMTQYQKLIDITESAEEKPIHAYLRYNRGEIEAEVVRDTGEIFKRVPASFKPIVNNFDYLSVSKIKAWEKCPGSLRDTYITVDDPTDSNDNRFSWIGTIAHNTIEIIERTFMEMQIVLDYEAVYQEQYAKETPPEANLNYKEWFVDGLHMVRDYFVRNPLGQSPYYAIAIEVEYRGPLGDCEMFGAKFDYVGIYREPDKDGKTVGILKDYKTNRIPISSGELNDSLQLGTYELILRKMFPQVDRWVTGFEALRFGWQECPERTPEQLKELEMYIGAVWKAIKETQYFPYHINDLCSFCSKKDTCIAYNEFLKNPRRFYDLVEVDKGNIDSIEKARKEFAAMEKMCKLAKEQMAEIVKAQIDNNSLNGHITVVDGVELFLTSQNRQSYKYSEVRDSLVANGKSASILNDAISLSKSKVDAIAHKHPELKLQILSLAKDNYTKPSIQTRKLRK